MNDNERQLAFKRGLQALIQQTGVIPYAAVVQRNVDGRLQTVDTELRLQVLADWTPTPPELADAEFVDADEVPQEVKDKVQGAINGR